MHEAKVTATATRKDGKGFKATLPEYGEVWLSLPDSEAGAVEWKKTYDITFTVKPGTKGNFYNVTKVTESRDIGNTHAAPNGGPDQPRVEDIGPHVGMWEKEAFDALRSGLTGAEIVIMGIEARQLARRIVQTDPDGKLAPKRAALDSCIFPGDYPDE